MLPNNRGLNSSTQEYCIRNELCAPRSGNKGRLPTLTAHLLCDPNLRNEKKRHDINKYNFKRLKNSGH